MTRRIVCTAKDNTFDVAAEISDSTQVASTCPLAELLPHMTEDFNTFFLALEKIGILKLDHGRYQFTEVHGSCPFAQTHPLEGREA